MPTFAIIYLGMIFADPNFIKIPYIRGLIAKQAHVSEPDGTVEEEYARNGFSGKYAHLYRSSAPTNWLDIEGPLKPRAYD